MLSGPRQKIEKRKDERANMTETRDPFFPVRLAFRVKHGAGNNAWQTVNGMSHVELTAHAGHALNLLPFVPAPSTRDRDRARNEDDVVEETRQPKIRVALKDFEKLDTDDVRQVVTVELRVSVAVVSSAHRFHSDAFAVQFEHYEDYLAVVRLIQNKNKPPPPISMSSVMSVLYDVEHQGALGRRIEELKTNPRRLTAIALDPRMEKAKQIVKWAAYRC